MRKLDEHAAHGEQVAKTIGEPHSPEWVQGQTADKVAEIAEATYPTRSLTIGKVYHDYQLDQPPHKRTPVSQITLKGHWLVQAGFEAGTIVNVEVQDGKLIITPES